jgi:hypothetical protein
MSRRQAEERKSGRPAMAGLVSGLTALVLYGATTNPDAWHGDVAQYHTLAATGGIAHAGYPAFVMVLRAFGLLPVSTFALRANLVSCLAGALAVGLAGYAAARLVRNAALGIVSALTLALSLTLWYNGTHASVHAFTLPISAGLFLLALRFSRGPSTRLAFGLGLLAGLGLVSHLSVLGLIPVAAAAAWVAGRERSLRVAHLGAVLGGLLVGLLPLVYMLAQDRPDQPMNYIEYTLDPGSGEHVPVDRPPPNRLERARWLLTGRQFLSESDYRPSQDVPHRLSYLVLDVSVNEFPFLGPPLAALGAWALWRRRSRTALLLGLWLAAVLGLLSYAAYPNIVRSFFLPGLWALSLFIAAGLDAIRVRRRWAAAVAACLLILAPIVRLQVPELPDRFAKAGSLARDVWSEWPRTWSPWSVDVSWEALGHLAMKVLPPRAVVLSTWNEGMTLRYFRYAQVLRPDVDVIMTGTESRRVERALSSARQARRPVFASFPPALAGLDSVARPADPRLRGSLWIIEVPRQSVHRPAPGPMR